MIIDCKFIILLYNEKQEKLEAARQQAKTTVATMYKYFRARIHTYMHKHIYMYVSMKRGGPACFGCSNCALMSPLLSVASRRVNLYIWQGAVFGARLSNRWQALSIEWIFYFFNFFRATISAKRYWCCVVNVVLCVRMRVLLPFYYFHFFCFCFHMYFFFFA